MDSEKRKDVLTRMFTLPFILTTENTPASNRSVGGGYVHYVQI